MVLKKKKKEKALVSQDHSRSVWVIHTALC